MKTAIKCLALLLLLSCNNDDEFKAENLKNILKLQIDNNNALSDGVDIVKVIAEFPLNFSTEDDNLVEFTVLNDGEEEVVQERIELIQENNIQKRIAILSVRNNKPNTLMVKAQISINGILISEEVLIQFKKAYLDFIEVSAKSLLITPNSFNEIELTTVLKRNLGNVSLNSIAETTVLDTLGIQRGFFNNYKNRTDSDGKIVNQYTMGNDDYEGNLFVIAAAFDESNTIVSDTTKIISQKNR